MRILYGILIVAIIPILSCSASKAVYKSQYAGQERGEIKSLSEADIAELKNGRGWGLAKAAELNGVPGPAHLLEMKKEIGLNAEQIEKIERLYQTMRNQAIPLGIKLYGSLKSSSWHKVLGYRVHIPSNVIPSNLG